MCFIEAAKDRQRGSNRIPHGWFLLIDRTERNCYPIIHYIDWKFSTKISVDYFGCKRNNTDLTQGLINTPCASFYKTTAYVLLQYRSATYTTFLPSLKYTLIQTECNKTKSKHLNASKFPRTSFVAEEIMRTNSETSNEQ